MTCSFRTEKSGHLFRCTLRSGHEGDHVWWLAAPTFGPVPVWTAETLIEDDWGNGKEALTCGNDGERGFDRGKIDPENRVLPALRQQPGSVADTCKEGST